MFALYGEVSHFLSLLNVGKGIADQDRNILANQVLLLGFLRSAPHVLVQGPMPVAPAKRKHISDDDDEDDAPEALTGSDDEAGETTASRGSVLITLRNVPPYTLWYASFSIVS
jgi:25S rRNA (uracil2634-N3)-methyltransferase